MALDDTLIAAVQLIRPGVDVKIDGRPDAVGWDADSASIKIARQRLERQGVDEVRETIGDGAGGGDGLMRERVYGNRRMVLTFTIDGNSQNLAETAEELADDLIAGFMRTDVLALLEPERLGAPACSDVRTIPFRDSHGDWRSVAVFEASFPWSRTHAPASTVTVDRIARVIGSGEADPGDHVVPFDVSEP